MDKEKHTPSIPPSLVLNDWLGSRCEGKQSSGRELGEFRDKPYEIYIMK